MDSKSNKMIITMIIILIIIVTTIIIAIIKLTKNEIQDSTTDVVEYDYDIVINDTLEKVTIRNDYYIVKNIIENYYSSLCNLNKTSKDILVLDYEGEEQDLDDIVLEEIKMNKNKLYNLFNQDYINETGLSIDNIQEKLGNYNDLHIIINEMYVREVTLNLNVYFAYGELIEKDNYKVQNFGLMIATDIGNSTFDIYTSDYISAHNLYESSKKTDFKDKYFNIDTIENRKYNTYDFEVIDDETYVKDLLKSYTQSIKYNRIDYSYNRLNEEYRTNRFKEKIYYEEYITKNKKQITIATLDYYKTEKYNDNKQYICVDKNKNYYIFNEKSIMDYTLTLDNYTVNIPSFVERYNNANPQEKVAMNIEKIIASINNQDYMYMYNKLDNTFKNSKYSIESDFKNHIKNMFFESNNIEYLEFSQEGNVYIYKTKITDLNANNSQERTFNVIMQLGEETEFTMSFNIE